MNTQQKYNQLNLLVGVTINIEPTCHIHDVISVCLFNLNGNTPFKDLGASQWHVSLKAQKYVASVCGYLIATTGIYFPELDI